MANQPYDTFTLNAEIEMEGRKFCAFMSYIGENWGDAYIVAPGGSRAGIVWTVGDGELEALLPPDEERWGVYQVSFKTPMKGIDDLRANFKDILPKLKAAYEIMSERKF